jgi:hypothetical protein
MTFAYTCGWMKVRQNANATCHLVHTTAAHFKLHSCDAKRTTQAQVASTATRINCTNSELSTSSTPSKGSTLQFWATHLRYTCYKICNKCTSNQPVLSYMKQHQLGLVITNSWWMLKCVVTDMWQSLVCVFCSCWVSAKANRIKVQLRSLTSTSHRVTYA